ncbi:hypothetical protein DESUT3_00560 [Desulfuromonas versatilis]|uniref:histidine kinase n=1 Tax=Desulfuromonas versatilis TaxID=2802975 RepID=A0ABM8HRA2_9BACT|nr:transporter substrate-binding domain-containing protein [Desulfuromonas versatilis]BCR02987.1 hypothetical protein DESUT3_00560 [Desulfuromonas versatilis]
MIRNGAVVFLTILLLISLGALCPAALAQPSPAESPLPSALSPVVAGSEYDYPPFCIVTKEGQADGFSVELLRAALRAMGREVRFHLGPWSEVKQALAERRVQVLPLVGRTPEREQAFDFTFPYLTMHGTIVVRDEETGIRSLDDLAGKQVAVMAGDNAEEFLRRQPVPVSIVTTETFEDALRELAEGRHDAVVIQKLLALQLMKGLGVENLKTVGPPLKEFVQSFCFAVVEGDRELLALLNEGLALVIADGTFGQLREKWFGPMEDDSWGKSRIVIGGDFNYPPYEFLDENGQPAGYNIDLTRAIAKEAGLSVEIRLGPWSEIRQGLSDKEIDGIQGMFYSLERDRNFDFSPVHTVVSHSVVVRDDSPMPRTLAELAGKSILVMKGDIMHDVALKQGYGEWLITARSQEQVLEMLAGGTGDCALIAKLPALYWIEKHGWKNLRVSDSSVFSPEYCYAVPNGNGALLARLSQGLAGLKATGEYRRIYSKWLGVYEKPQVGLADLFRYSLFVVLPIVLLLFASLAWSRMLQRKVEGRTAELRNEIAWRKQVEEKLYRTQKFEAIGQLAGGVAHDFNNLLTVIVGYSDMLRRRLKADPAALTEVEMIAKAAQRAESLTRQLLAFGRRQVLAPRDLNLVALIHDAQPLLQKLLKENVQLKIRSTLEQVTVKVDPAQIEQVLMNLVVNARDAIGEKDGEIVISTTIAELDAQALGEFAETAGKPFGLLTVEDSGCGIAPEVKEKIFDPFFTTKELGRGTGLGLSTVYGIVKQSEGFVFADSAPGKGSRFHVYLPLGSLPEAAPAVRSPWLGGAEKSATILVVDDDELVLTLAVQTLREQGHEVLAANSSAQALGCWRANHGRIELLLTDIGLPEVNGLSLAAQMKEEKSELKVLYFSGYADLQGAQIPEGAFLQKPFPPAALVTKIEGLLKRAP